MRFSSPGVLPSSGHPPHSSEGSRCPHLVRGITVLLAKDVMVPVPPADMKAGFFFQPLLHCAQESGGLRPILGLRILNGAFHKPPFKMLMQNCVFGCIRPQVRSAALTWKTRTSMCRSFRTTGHSCGWRSKDEHISTGPALRAVPVAPCLVAEKVAEAALVPLREQGVRILNYLDDWLILAQSWDQLCEHRDRVLSHLSQLGLQVNWERAELSPVQRISFLGMELDSVSQTARLTQERAQSVLNCLNTFKNRTAAPLKQFQRAPGAYGGCGGGHAAGAAPYETASTLAPWPSPEVGVAERHAEGPSHSSLPPNLHPVVRPFIPSGRSAPGTGLQARCGLHRRLRQGLGGHVQRACSVGGLDGSPTALAHQLPRVAGSTPGLEPSQETLTRRACTSPYGQLCDRCVHQPTRWSTLPSHVTTRPPPPPLESEASEVTSRHSYPGLAQPDSRRAVTSCAPRRMETPSPDGPADLATFWTRTGRPVRVPRDVALPVVLLPDRWNTRHGRTGTQLAAGPSQICISPSEPSRTDTVQGQRGRGADPARLPGLGSQSWCSSWQPLPGRFLWGRIYWLRDGAPYGTRVQTSGNFMSGP